MNNKKITFPKDFLWGGASAAEQYEGKGDTGKGKTVWDKFYEVDPKAFYNEVGPSITSDFANKYNEDIELYKTFGVNSVRLGVSWARLQPEGKEFSKQGIDFYHKILDKCAKEGVKVVLNIFHFDMPLWAHEMGNWESKEVVSMFKEFARKVFDEFGNKVDYIATFNEPGVPVIAGYQAENHWPRVKDNRRAFQVGYGILLAHAKAVNLYNDEYKGKIKAKIGVVINVNPPIVKDGITGSEEDKKAAWEFDLLHNNYWLYPMVKGQWPKGGIEFAKENNVVPKHTQEELEEIKRVKIDFLGTNYYAPTRIVRAKKPGELFFSRFETFKYDKARYNVFRGWEIRPESLYDLSMIIKRDFDNIPFFISENGMGVENEEIFRDKESGVIQDDYRIAFLQEHLEQLAKGMKEGANCFGYHMWAITDNWSWRNAYKNRYGFIEIDLSNQKRILKKSAHWFKKCIENNGFDAGFKKIEETIDLSNIKFTPSV